MVDAEKLICDLVSLSYGRFKEVWLSLVRLHFNFISDCIIWLMLEYRKGLVNGHGFLDSVFCKWSCCIHIPFGSRLFEPQQEESSASQDASSDSIYHIMASVSNDERYPSTEGLNRQSKR